MGGDEHDDYLWNRGGARDPEIARLERLLGGLAFVEARDRANAPSTSKIRPTRTRGVRTRRRWAAALALAATLAVCALGVRAWYVQRLQWESGRPWTVLARHGDVRVDAPDRSRSGKGLLAVGDTIRTGPGAGVRLRVARIGQLALAGDSRLRLRETGSGLHRVELEQGRLWARVWAPPGRFGVGIAGAEVLDLGCEFVLDVDARGRGALTVRSGWVQVDSGFDEVLVPEGTTVRLGDGRAQGTPRDVRASAAFVAALDAVDAQRTSLAPDGAQMRRLLAAARPSDLISLVSLVRRDPALAEGPVYERIVQWLPDAPLVTRAELRAQGADATSAWWDALPYPRMKRWWLQWPDALPSASADDPTQRAQAAPR